MGRRPQGEGMICVSRGRTDPAYLLGSGDLNTCEATAGNNGNEVGVRAHTGGGEDLQDAGDNPSSANSLSTIVSELELVEVGLKVLTTGRAVVSAHPHTFEQRHGGVSVLKRIGGDVALLVLHVLVVAAWPKGLGTVAPIAIGRDVAARSDVSVSKVSNSGAFEIG